MGRARDAIPQLLDKRTIHTPAVTIAGDRRAVASRCEIELVSAGSGVKFCLIAYHLSAGF